MAADYTRKCSQGYKMLEGKSISAHVTDLCVVLHVIHNTDALTHVASLQRLRLVAFSPVGSVRYVSKTPTFVHFDHLNFLQARRQLIIIFFFVPPLTCFESHSWWDISPTGIYKYQKPFLGKWQSSFFIVLLTKTECSDAFCVVRDK